ncbi:TPA: hypothetical protein ACLMQK_004226 [Yersinia enterocolitica]|uniref:hypothetical protein n=1 Tax=Yersinia vastinensis TaxID=2890318 RepID=UPI00119D9AC9|nr:hypothetical protein [Yersinia vastinensis]EKN6007623.1 hypothetical protein [Yersinia enterocolitica]HEN3495171.1 hypothetical protein [Yersinia enterocolitica]
MNKKHMDWSTVPISVTTSNMSTTYFSATVMEKHHQNIHHLYLSMSDKFFFQRISDLLYAEKMFKQSISDAKKEWSGIFGENKGKEVFDTIFFEEIKCILSGYHEFLISLFNGTVKQGALISIELCSLRKV